MDVSVGMKVAARGLEWDVTDVEPLGAQHRVRLRCIGGDLAGLEWHVLHPLERLQHVRTDPDPADIAPIQDWRRYHLARLLEQLPGIPAPAGRLTIESWQKVPLLRALDMARPRLLLADGVGLGKTVQAGLIAAELIVRRRAHRILVVTPPGPLLRQWEQEMRLRFGLRFTPIADAADLRTRRRGLEHGANPFGATALCLTSLDFAKQDHVLKELERVAWDLVIIDEAHHCVADGTRNQRRTLAEVLAAQSDGLLLLTATPHDGHDEHFASLMTLLDPSLVDAAGKLVGSAYRRHVVRRLKSHIRNSRTGAPVFRDRIVLPIKVDASASEPVRAFHRALSDLVAPRLRRSGRHADLTDALAFVSLLKRSMSTVAACVATLRVVAERYADADTQPASKDRRRALRTWRRRVARYGVLDPAAEEAIADLEAEDMASRLRGSETLADLQSLIALGETASADDPKLAALILEVRLIRLQQPDANILVYTEYAESQRAATAALARSLGYAIGGIILTIGGADSDAERAGAADRFATESGIILVSTDSLAEGLNLQARCHHLIHLDLPYNPNRLEQRNGRIDRYGQQQDPEIRYLFLADTFEERLLLRLIAKYEKARACLAFMPNTLAVTADPRHLAEPLFEGDLFARAPRLIHSLDLLAEDVADDSYRDLLREIDRAFQSFDLMAVRHGWLSGHETPASATDCPLGVDLTEFVASVLVPAADGHAVPEAWRSELVGLPGYDAATGVVRLTSDATCVRDEAGRTRLYPGRSHPLVRRAVAAVQGGRVSVVTAEQLSLLATFIAEAGTLFRQVFGLLLFADGAVQHVTDVLAFAPARPTSGRRRSRLAGTWETSFAAWAPQALQQAGPLQAAEQTLAPLLAEHRARWNQEVQHMHACLRRRADTLCGPALLTTPDLFDAAPLDDWRTSTAPEERLTAFANDAAVERTRRREAAAALAQFHAIRAETTPPVTVRPLGLLMRVP